MKRLAIAVALVGLISTPALAQNKKPRAKKARRPVPAKVVKTCKGKKATPECAKEVTFGKGDTLEGDRPAGDGDTITGVTGTRFGSLIRVRTSFLPEILKSAEGL